MQVQRARPSPHSPTSSDLPPRLRPASVGQGDVDGLAPRPREEGTPWGLAALATALGLRRPPDFAVAPRGGGGWRTGVRCDGIVHDATIPRPRGGPGDGERVFRSEPCARRLHPGRLRLDAHHARWMWSPSSMTSSGPVHLGETRWAHANRMNDDRCPGGTTTSSARPLRWNEPGTPPTARLR